MGRLQKAGKAILDCFSHLYTRRSYYRGTAFSSFPYKDYASYYGRFMDGGVRPSSQLYELLEMSALREAIFPKMVVSQFIREKVCSLQATEVGVSESRCIMDAKIESARGLRVYFRRRIINNQFDSNRHSRRGKYKAPFAHRQILLRPERKWRRSFNSKNIRALKTDRAAPAAGSRQSRFSQR